MLTAAIETSAQRLLTLWPASSPAAQGGSLHRRLQPLRYLHDCSDCYRLERQLPGGTRIYTASNPLLNTRSSRQGRISSVAAGPCDPMESSNAAGSLWPLKAFGQRGAMKMIEVCFHAFCTDAE